MNDVPPNNPNQNAQNTRMGAPSRRPSLDRNFNNAAYIDYQADLRDSGGDDDILSCGMTETLVGRVRKLVEPAYLRDVEDTLSGRWQWRKIGDWSEASSRILEGLASMLAFAAGTYDMFELSFAAGCTATMALVLGLWTNYARRESRERARELNSLLKTLHLPEIPDLAAQQQDGGPSSNNV